VTDSPAHLHILPGRSALSAARRESALDKIRTVSPDVTSVEARWVHIITSSRELTAAELGQLSQMLSYGPVEGGAVWQLERVSVRPGHRKTHCESRSVGSAWTPKGSVSFRAT